MDLNSIAKSLADSEASTRSEGFVRIRSYVSSSFPVDQLPRVWKSLFDCNPQTDFWMAGKPNEETVEEIFSLYKSVNIGHLLWFSSFMEIMRSEWEGVELVGVDKCLLLFRSMLRGALASAIDNTKEWAGILTAIIEKSIHKFQSLLLHLTDILLDELPPCPFSTKRKIIKPLITLMKSCKLNHLIDLVYNKILLKLIDSKEPGLEKWLFSLATSKEKIQDKSRDRFYDAYSLILEGSVPNRQDLGRNEGSASSESPEKKKKKKKKLQPEGIPEALQKVMNEFYQQPIEEELDSLGVGKDIIELKHEQDSGTSAKRKKRKSKKPQDAYDKLAKDPTARTGQSVDFPGQDLHKSHKKKANLQDKRLRKVNFNLKLNSTKFFDTKNIVCQSPGSNGKVPGKGILKTRGQDPTKPVKKQKTK